MSKLRVHDMATEFGIPAEEVVTLLRTMDVPVRSHVSVLSDDQVSRIRARWEREKRERDKRAKEPAPAAGARRRRGTAKPAAEAVEVAAKPAAKPAARPKRAAPAPAPAPPPPEPAPAAEAPAARRRRRAAAEVPPPEPVVPVVDEAGLAATPLPPTPHIVDVSPIVLEEQARKARVEARAAADREAGIIAEPEPAPAVEEVPPPRPVERPARTEPREERPTPTTFSSVPMPQSGSGTERPRPRPIVPGAPRPKPVATGVPFQPPRPVASAQPGYGGGAPRRDDKGGGAGPSGGRRKKGKRGQVDQEAVTANISKTMTALRGAPARRGVRRADDGSREEMEAQKAADAERERTTVRVNEFITVSELAGILKIPATQIVAFAFKNLGLMVTINQRLDFDQIELIAGEFGFQAVREEEYSATDSFVAPADSPEELSPRPAVVTIMGHVDHGKTSLLDYVRKANVVAGEAGGITQHIGAYHVTLSNGKAITFLDTPGHEAFTAMRARGAQVTDIVVLVVAADDQVMPQTIEAISHAKNAGVPIVVAINKIDLPQANPGKVKQDLLQHGVVVEEFGGSALSMPISAKKGTNVKELLDQILLQAEILDLKANASRRATGTVIEAQLDPGKGPVATVLVQNGTLKVGEDFICGMFSGRVRALLDERGKPVKEAGPAIPVQVLGMAGVPMAGDQFLVVEDATASREIAQRRQRLDREAKSRRTSKGVTSLEDFMTQSAAGQKRALRLVIKADQGGPAEALADALGQLSNQEVQVEVIHRGVGAVTESDVLLAKASGAIIIGFHVRPDNNARTTAEREGVDIKLYKIIYEAVADVRAALEGLLRPEEREVIFGEAEVRETFKVPKVGIIAGCFVRTGIINRQGRVRVVRDGSEVYVGTVGSLRRFKDDVREVKEGYECGIGIENFNDIKVGDVLEFFKKEEVARTLVSSPA